MAKAVTYVGSDVAIQLETTTPGTYARPCGLTSHTFSFSKNMEEVDVPDCDDYEAASWIERGVRSLDFSGTGSGILDANAKDLWWDAFSSTSSVNARIYIGSATDTENGVFWQGKVHVSGFEITGNRGSKAEVSISIASDGELVYTPVT